MRPDETLTEPLLSGHNAFMYLFEGRVSVAEATLEPDHLATFTDGDRVTLVAGKKGARLLLLAGKPLGEPIAQYGPFVMNTQDEINQALRDYRDGTLTAEASRL